MRTVPVFLLSLFLAVSATAQTQGVIDCRAKSGVPAWEKPRSLLVVKQLTCGQKVTILGTESTFVKVRINKGIEGFVEATYIKSSDDKDADSALQAQAD